MLIYDVCIYISVYLCLLDVEFPASQQRRLGGRDGKLLATDRAVASVGGIENCGAHSSSGSGFSK